LKEIDSVFDLFGPTPRLCFDKLMRPGGIDAHNDTLNSILAGLTSQQLMDLVDNSGALAADKVSHKICLISRNGDQMSGKVNVQPITKFVESRLVVCLRNLQIKDQIQLYNRFARVPAARRMTGPLFEAHCQLRFQTQISLEFISMVRLPDPDPKPEPTRKARPTKKRKVVDGVLEKGCRTHRPQWHSSHVKLPDEMEQLRMAALSRPGHLRVRPSDTYEYDARQPLCIMSDGYYLPKQDNQVALDSFILHENFLYIFQFTSVKQYGINEGLVSFFENCQQVPARANWRFIFIIPHDVDIVKCPASPNAEILELKIFSSIVPMTEDKLGDF
jgi:hypothetical protein